MSGLFGTDGVRGEANSQLTADLAYNLGSAGAYVLANGSKRPRILVARDTRLSGNMLQAALVAGILSVGADAVIAGVIPTPAVAYLTGKYGCNAGIMISASHNPMQDNGIKFITAQGYKLPDETEAEIERIINEKADMPMPTGADIGTVIDADCPEELYIKFLRSTVDTRFDGLRLVLDCANGAASSIAPELFAQLGVDVIVINNKPDGTNINLNCGSTHPEGMCNAVVANHADGGFAFDGDADRLIACDENGKIIDGDHVLAVCGKMLKREGRLKGNTVVGTVMSNMGLDIATQKIGINLEKSKVGDRYVLELMLNNGYCLGGEKSGHVIFLDYNTTGDGMLTALQLLRACKKAQMPLSGVFGIIQDMPQVLINMVVQTEHKQTYLDCEPVKVAIENAALVLNGHGRVFVRPSGTEPLLRVMLEGESIEQINELGCTIAAAMEQHLGAKRR